MLTLYQVIPMQYVDIIPGNTNANALYIIEYVDIIPGNTNAIC